MSSDVFLCQQAREGWIAVSQPSPTDSVSNRGGRKRDKTIRFKTVRIFSWLSMERKLYTSRQGLEPSILA
jgi:hypothetical protein